MENRLSKSSNRDFAITLLHVIGMVMILLCHMMQAERIYFLSEIFISGVPLFLLVSGYLAGLKEITRPHTWLLRKAKRVWIPLFVMIVLVYGGYSVFNVAQITPFQWIFTLLDLQGLNYTYWKFEHFGAVPGCGHWWFVTTLMICYLLTPLMQRFKKFRLRGWQKPLLFVGVLLVQLGLLLLGFQLSYIITFFFGYFIGGKSVRTDVKWFSFISVLTALALAGRLIARKVVDGSDVYDRYIALISAACIAAWLFYCVYFIKEHCPRLIRALDGKAIDSIERISYYFYLTHYLFLSGPLAIFHFIENRLMAHIAVIVCSYASAVLLYVFVEKCLFRLTKRSRK